MKERSADLFVVGRVCSSIVITTNGTVKNDGRAVMGRGVARTARDRWKDIDSRLGAFIRAMGNNVHVLGRRKWHGHRYYVVSFPVKHSWWEDADLKLIRKSAEQLVSLADERGWRLIAMPRPGCGNGKLKWSRVKKKVEDILDDRFIIVNNEGKVDASRTIICQR
jgi:hypothetical protein